MDTMRLSNEGDLEYLRDELKKLRGEMSDANNYGPWVFGIVGAVWIAWDRDPRWIWYLHAVFTVFYFLLSGFIVGGGSRRRKQSSYKKGQWGVLVKSSKKSSSGGHGNREEEYDGNAKLEDDEDD